MSARLIPYGNVWLIQDGDVWRIEDHLRRRYYWCPKDSSEAFWADERYSANPDAWDEHTGFSEREAKLLVDAIWREQRVLAVADKLAASLLALNDGCGVAREWRSRRSDG